MHVRVRPRGAVEVLDISPEPPSEPGAGRLDERLAGLLDAGECLFVLDLTAKPELDCASLGELIACRERVRRRGGVIKLVLTARQRARFVASSLDYLFEIFPDEDDALDSFFQEATTEGIP